MRFKKNKLVDFLLLNYGCVFTQLRLIAILVTTCFLFGASVLAYTSISKSLLFLSDPKGLLSIFLFFLFFMDITLLFVNVSALGFWISAKMLKGQGTFFPTSIALLRTLVYVSIPFGLSFVVHELLFEPIGEWVASFGFVASLIYGTVLLTINLAKAHNMSTDRAFVVGILGILFQMPFMMLLGYFIYMNFRPLFEELVPLTVQILTILLVLFAGSKLLQKFSKRPEEEPNVNSSQ